MGGKTFEAKGNYDWMWYADCVLAVGVHMTGFIDVIDVNPPDS
jgi:hypothetical protein